VVCAEACTSALAAGGPSELAESVFHALEGTLRIFEKHRQLILDQLKRRPEHTSAPIRHPERGVGACRSAAVRGAFGVPIETDPRALAILHEWVKTTGTEMNEARLRMTRLPKGADLILNKVSGAPSFWIGNVIVMAGVPSIMQAMLDEVAPKLKIGVRMLSETVRADAREGDIGMQLAEIAKAHPEVAIGSYPFSISSTGPTRMWCCAPAMHRSSLLPNARSKTCWSECGEHNQVAEARPLTAKTGVRVPLQRPGRECPARTHR
jgi:hypothetical protein